MPPSLRRLHQHSPSWAESKAGNSNVGVLYDARIGDFTIDFTAFRSIIDIDRTDYTLISADADGRASATTFRNPDRAKSSDSVEARVGRQFEAGGFSHLTTASLRGGRAVVDLTSNLAIPLGTFDLRHENPPDAMEVPWSGTRGKDTVQQVTASAGYGLAWNDRVQLRFAAHRTRYEKDVYSIAGVRTERVSDEAPDPHLVVCDQDARHDVFSLPCLASR